ncbi:MAG: hypothetical protein ABI560_00765 [Myxococcales bacterium]
MTVGEVHFSGGPGTPGDGAGGRSGDAAGALGGTPFSMGAIFRVPVARRGAGVGAFVLAIVTAGALAHVGVRLKGLEVAYDLGRERRIATEMEEQRRRLQIEIGMLKDPRRVIAIARDKLNMGPPAPDAIWRLGSGRPGRSAAGVNSAPAREKGAP